MNADTFFQFFDLLAEAPNSVAKLRELILQLAVQGKLGTQDSKDEPALMLLERALNWQQRGVAEKRIRLPKKEMSAILKSDAPFQLPTRWEWTRLGQIIYIHSGDGLTSKDMREGNIPVFGGNGVNGHHDSANVHIPTLVIGRVGYYCGSIHITPQKAWITDNAFVTEFCDDAFDLAFLALL